MPSALPAQFPRGTTGAHDGTHGPPEALLNHWVPRQETEPHPIVEHGVAPADKLHAAPVIVAHLGQVAADHPLDGIPVHRQSDRRAAVCVAAVALDWGG